MLARALRCRSRLLPWQSADSDTIIPFAHQGLTKPDLMDDLGRLLALPVYQLALPFIHEA